MFMTWVKAIFYGGSGVLLVHVLFPPFVFEDTVLCSCLNLKNIMVYLE